MGLMSFTKDLDSMFSEYGKYHTHPINQLIHIICIPLILGSFIGLGRYFPLGQETDCICQAHYGLLFLVLILSLYLKVDIFSGIAATLLYGGLYLVWNYIYFTYTSMYGTIILYTQIICWSLQFFGHGFFENNRPALFDNIALTLAAPLFVVLEVLMIFGYKAYLHDLLKKKSN
ncbi:hypothetical protein SteCoe_29851 [Stentor coeruleus]|uniref:DUF962 domain-containing protein n=1 Tax=Stentor coeruleus TaxID=5963 RepID=A0A1R2B4X7_9CILI|nr:hypothetical protein SteCoe_29851 [Stentor coeruleus]